MVDWDVTPDSQRRDRLGFDEAVFCAGKSADQVGRILANAGARGETVLLTRLRPAQLSRLPTQLRDHIDYDEVSRTGFFGTVEIPQSKPRIGVITAGTSDVGVAREASRTLMYYGEGCSEVHDVGVAGLWRLLERVEDIRRIPIVIVVAGMDAALPSVVAGLVPGAVIAVPTSTGYGVAARGFAALQAALASCAPGLVVVNIDNGYGAACAALRIVKTFH